MTKLRALLAFVLISFLPTVSAQTGISSWYGGKFQGRKTASGIRFDTHQLMAAHRSLPFGTKVKVTNLSNNRSVIVTIEDRGPFVRGRILDLSYAAKQAIGMGGTAKVSLAVLH